MTGFSQPGLLSELLGDSDLAAQFTPEAEIAAMVRFEAALADVEAKHGVIPTEAGPAIAAALSTITVDPAELVSGTASAGVAVPALVAGLRRDVGEPHGPYIHWGATSQDVTDTGLVLRLVPVLATLSARLDLLCETLAEKARAFADQPMAARTRSQLATPTSLGLRIAGWRAPLDRCRQRLAELRPRLLYVQFGGAAGTLSILGEKGPAVADGLAQHLGLMPAPKPWHSERDGLVEFGNWLAMVSGLLGRIGGDLILMGRSEAREISTGSGGGSSTMPQKSNPVAAEALMTLAHQNAGHVATLQRCLMHQEERDGPPWSLEWLVLPQMIVATGAGLNRAIEVCARIEPIPDRMGEILSLDGRAVHAEALAFALAEQVPLPRAQAIVKEAAKTRGEASLQTRIAEICRAKGIDPPEFDPEGVAEPIGALVDRSLGNG